MDDDIIQFSPERIRGEQQARFGRGHSQGIKLPGETHRRRMTPSELASWKLNRALEKYPEFTKEGRQGFQDEFVDMPGLRTMNMKVMAATISFINHNKPSVDTFKDQNIIPYMKELLPTEIDSTELKKLIIRFKAQILIYIRAIEIFRST